MSESEVIVPTADPPPAFVTKRSLKDPRIVTRAAFPDWALAMAYAKQQTDLDYAVMIRERVSFESRNERDLPTGPLWALSLDGGPFVEERRPAKERAMLSNPKRLDEVVGFQMFVFEKQSFFMHWVYTPQGRLAPVFCHAEDPIVPGPCVHCDQYAAAVAAHRVDSRQPIKQTFFYIVKCSDHLNGPKPGDGFEAVRVPGAHVKTFENNAYLRVALRTNQQQYRPWDRYVFHPLRGEEFNYLPKAMLPYFAEYLVQNDIIDNIVFRPNMTNHFQVLPNG